MDKQLIAQKIESLRLRNVAVHNYERINWVIVHAIVNKHMSDFSRFAKQIYSYIDQPTT